MCDFSCFNENTSKELFDVVKLFFQDPDESVPNIKITVDNFSYCVKINGVEYIVKFPPLNTKSPLEIKRYSNRYAKNALYNALKGHLRRGLAWGSLTGIRPTKLLYELIQQENSQEKAMQILACDYDVSPPKINLLKMIVNAQKGYYFFDDNLVNFYVHIPFCSTVCSYCSFVTQPLTKSLNIVDEYLEKLIFEIRFTKQILKDYGKKIYSVYIGGGTPTCLNAGQLYKLLSEFSDLNVEYTAEAGRPDTIDDDKLKVMKQCNVTRICLNPQTLNNETLKLIGRRHSADEFCRCYETAQSYGFEINSDLIAGFTNESLNDFKNSLDKIIALRPHNITVHTLAKKRGSKMENIALNPDIFAMIDYSQQELIKSGYVPYYLYRQKQTASGLENAGYSLPGYVCKNNITTMEELLSVAACGAGGISKIVDSKNSRIERLANLRDVKLYLEQSNQRNEIKREFLKNQFTKN